MGIFSLSKKDFTLYPVLILYLMCVCPVFFTFMSALLCRHLLPGYAAMLYVEVVVARTDFTNRFVILGGKRAAAGVAFPNVVCRYVVHSSIVYVVCRTLLLRSCLDGFGF